MDSSFLSESEAIINDPLVIIPDTNNSSLEANANLWTLGISPEQACNTPPEEIKSFLYKVIASREQYLITKYNYTYPMYFYCWVDTMVGQLRFSLIGTQHIRLPFSSPISIVNHLDNIITQFLSCVCSDINSDTQMHYKECTDEIIPSSTLEVWMQVIPRND